MIGIVGIGWLGAHATLPSDAVTPVRSPIAPADDIAAAEGWVRLDSPAHPGQSFASRAIVIRGEVGPAVTVVWLGLESRNGKLLATRTIRRTDPSQRANMSFESLFGLASPSGSGRLFVTVTAIGIDGVPTQSIRRRIEATAAIVSHDPRADGLHRGPHADLGIGVLLSSSPDLSRRGRQRAT